MNWLYIKGHLHMYVFTYVCMYVWDLARLGWVALVPTYLPACLLVLYSTLLYSECNRMKREWQRGWDG